MLNSTDVLDEEFPKKFKGKMNEFHSEDYLERLFTDESYLSNMMSLELEYKEYILKRENPLELSALFPNRYSFDVFVTPSARKSGEWQVTIFQKGEPFGHREYETFEEAVSDNVSEWFNQGLWFVK